MVILPPDETTRFGMVGKGIGICIFIEKKPSTPEGVEETADRVGSRSIPRPQIRPNQPRCCLGAFRPRRATEEAGRRVGNKSSRYSPNDRKWDSKGLRPN